MARIIESIEIIHQHEDGPDFYQIGKTYNFGKDTIGDIVEVDGVYKVFNEKEELYMEIKNCPVVVRYTNESEVK